MKTLVNHSDKAIKIAVNMTGDIIVTLPGGEVVNGKLSVDELEQFAFRLTAMSEGKISFEPAANDLIAVHYEDIVTLEKQAALLEQQREEIYLLASLNQRLEDCEKDLVEARGNLKDSRQAMSLMQEKIELFESAVSEREADALMNSDIVELATADKIYIAESPDSTVHNERSDPDTEKPPPPDSTVHNERLSDVLAAVGIPEHTEEEMPLL